MKKVQLLLLLLPITLRAQDSTAWKLQFINTLAQYRSQLIHKTVESPYDLNGTIIKGTKKNAMLPQKMDKIIIRNSFHHFSKKTHMLASIRSALNPGGRLFINEPLKHDRPGACKQLMWEEEIKFFFEQNGFVLEREKRLGGDLLLEYSF